MTTARERPARASRLADVSLGGLIFVLTVFTVAVVAGGAVAPAIVNDRLDIAIVTVSTMTAAAVAALARSRGRVTHEPDAHLRASAFTVLATLNLVMLLAPLAGAEETLGAALEDPQALPVVIGAIARAIAAGLLAVAGWAALARRVPPFREDLLLVAPAALVLGLLALGTAVPATVPPLVPTDALGELRADPTAPITAADAPALFVVQTLIGVAFVIAAWLAYRAYRRSVRSGDLLMAAGLVFAAFSQVHSAIHPGSYAGLVTTADLLRLAFYGILVLGLVAESRQDIADLRAATAEVRRLAAAQFAAAGLEERARLAREIHDGLAQDLWYAKLKHSRLQQIAPLDEEARALSSEVETAIDAALAEARHAVAAMRAGSTDGPLLEILDRLVADFNDRFAIRATLEHDGAVPTMSPRAQAETLRIVQEALTNARRHADATVVRVRVTTDGEVGIVVADNGRGFDMTVATPGFGLESMRQRAELIGARLHVASEPQNGTRVEITIPQAR